MTTTIEQPTDTTPVETVPVERPDEFHVKGSDQSLGRNLPQRVGRRLWLPMLLMAPMAFAVGIILAIVRADITASADPADADTVARLGHLVPGFMFLGFAAVFAAVSFAIARILGEFRKGGGEVQQAVTGEVQTLRMPWTAVGFLAFMMMGMMALLGAVTAHFVVAGTVPSLAEADLVRSEQWAIALEGVRRIGVALYLVGVALGLGTIVTVLRFQAVRIREVVGLD